jgi:hypothetical protein
MALMRTRTAIAAVVASGAVLLAASLDGHAEWLLDSMWGKLRGGYRVEERLAQFGERAQARLAPYFASAQLVFPPARVALVAFKDSRILELYAPAPDGSWRVVRSYPILAASGVVGPKLREGDEQVPEGIYALTSLNPNSRFHVSLRLGYPNEFDHRMAQADGRTALGGDIMIHGKALSSGCLAMGDEAAEELFTLVAATGLHNARTVISPTDFRRGPSQAVSAALDGGMAPAWAGMLYRQLAGELSNYPGGAAYPRGAGGDGLSRVEVNRRPP